MWNSRSAFGAEIYEVERVGPGPEQGASEAEVCAPDLQERGQGKLFVSQLVCWRGE